MAEGTQVGSLFYDLSIDDKNLQGQLNAADKKVGDFGQKLHDGLNKAAAGFAVIGAGLTVIAKQSTDFAVNAVKNAKSLGTQIGVSTEEASRLTAAFGRMGLSAESASQMFGVFSKNIVQATKDAKAQGQQSEEAQLALEKTRRKIAETTAEIQKNGDKTGDLTFKLRELNATLASQQQQLASASNAFQRLGISTVDAKGTQKGFNDLLFEVADKFKDLPNGIDKTALAMELFGRSGKDMIKVLNLGSSGIKDLEAQADKLGLTLTSSNISAINDYIQSQKDLKQSTDALKLAVGTTTAPVLTAFNKSVNDIVLGLISSDGPMKTLTVNVLAFGGPIAAATAGLLAFAANLVTAAPAIAKATSAVWAMTSAVTLSVAPYVAAGAAVAAFAYVIIANFDTIKNAVITAVQAIGGWLVMLPVYAGNAVQGVVNWFTELPGRILGAMGDLSKLLLNAGADLIRGLIEGIVGMFATLAKKVKDAVGKAVDGVKGFLGIHSPSTVFMEIGRNVTAGFVKGITDTSGQAMDAMGKLANNVISPTMNLTPVAAGAQVGKSTTFGDTVVNIDTINNAQDEAYVIRRIDRNQQLEGMGISPTV